MECGVKQNSCRVAHVCSCAWHENPRSKPPGCQKEPGPSSRGEHTRGPLELREVAGPPLPSPSPPLTPAACWGGWGPPSAPHLPSPSPTSRGAPPQLRVEEPLWGYWCLPPRRVSGLWFLGPRRVRACCRRGAEWTVSSRTLRRSAEASSVPARGPHTLCRSAGGPSQAPRTSGPRVAAGRPQAAANSARPPLPRLWTRDTWVHTPCDGDWDGASP